MPMTEREASSRHQSVRCYSRTPGLGDSPVLGLGPLVVVAPPALSNVAYDPMPVMTQSSPAGASPLRFACPFKAASLLYMSSTDRKGPLYPQSRTLVPSVNREWEALQRLHPPLPASPKGLTELALGP